MKFTALARSLRHLALPGLALMIVSSVQAETVNLRPDWQPGQSATYELWSLRTEQMNLQFGPESMDESMETETEGEITWTVDSVNNDGSAEATMRIEWLSVTMRGDGEQVVNDTRRGSGDIDMLHDMLSAMTGSDLTVSVHADGSISGVGGLRQIQRAAPDADMAPDERDMQQTASELATLVAAPAEAQVGSTWSTRQTWNHQLGEVTRHLDFELAEVGSIGGVPVATVFGEAQVDVDIEQPELPEGMPPMNLNVRDAEFSSQILFDLDRNEVAGRNSLERLVVEQSMRIPDQGEMSQRVEQTVQSQILRIAEE